MPVIKTTEGDTINSNHIVKFTKLRNGETKFLLSTGDTVTAAVRGDVDDRFYPIIPANPGHAGVFASRWDGEFSYRVRSVIAWRICPGGNFPIFGDEGEELDDYNAMIDPHGGVSDYEGNAGLTLSEWKKIYEAEVLAGEKDAA